MSRQLSASVAIVTGGSSGIGRAIAIAFAAEGATVVVADVNAEPVEGGERTTDIISHSGGAASYKQANVATWREVDLLVQEVVSEHGRLDIMVNNAATYAGTALLETSIDEWNRVLAVNLTGMFNGCRRAVQQMLTQQPRDEVRGRLINIGSQHGIVSCPGDPAYGVTKAGAIYMTRQIAVDYAKDLIVCNCISPGKIITGQPGLANDPARMEYARRRTPWPRLGRPADVANAAVFLASNRATYITGSNLVVDGGWLAG